MPYIELLFLIVSVVQRLPAAGKSHYYCFYGYVCAPHNVLNVNPISLVCLLLNQSLTQKRDVMQFLIDHCYVTKKTKKDNEYITWHT